MESLWWETQGDARRPFPDEFLQRTSDGSITYDTQGVIQRKATFHWRQRSFATVAQLMKELLNVWHEQKYLLLDSQALAVRGAASAAAHLVHGSNAPAVLDPSDTAGAAVAASGGAAAATAPTETALRSLVWRSLDRPASGRHDAGPGQAQGQGQPEHEPDDGTPMVQPQTPSPQPPETQPELGLLGALLPPGPLLRQLGVDVFGGVMARGAEPEALCGWEPSPCFPLARGGLRVLPNLRPLHAAAHRHRRDVILNAVIVVDEHHHYHPHQQQQEEDEEGQQQHRQEQQQQQEEGAAVARRKDEEPRAFLVEGPGGVLVPLQGGPSPAAVGALWEAVSGALGPGSTAAGAPGGGGADASAVTADAAAALVYDILSRNWAHLEEGALVRSVPYRQLSEPDFPAGLLRTYLSCTTGPGGGAGSSGGAGAAATAAAGAASLRGAEHGADGGGGRSPGPVAVAVVVHSERGEAPRDGGGVGAGGVGEEEEEDEGLRSLRDPALLARARAALARSLGWQPAGSPPTPEKPPLPVGGAKRELEDEAGTAPDAQRVDVLAGGSDAGGGGSPPAPGSGEQQGGAAGSGPAPQQSPPGEGRSAASAAAAPALSLEAAAAERVVWLPRRRRPAPLSPRHPRPFRHPERYFLWPPEPLPVARWVLADPEQPPEQPPASSRAGGVELETAAAHTAVAVASEGVDAAVTPEAPAADAEGMGAPAPGGARGRDGDDGGGSGGGAGVSGDGEPQDSGAGGRGGRRKWAHGGVGASTAAATAAAAQLDGDVEGCAAASHDDDDLDTDPVFHTTGLQPSPRGPAAAAIRVHAGWSGSRSGDGSDGGGSSEAAGDSQQQQAQGQSGQVRHGAGQEEEPEAVTSTTVPAAAQADPGGSSPATPAAFDSPVSAPVAPALVPPPAPVLPGLRHLPPEEAASLQEAFRRAAAAPAPRHTFHLYGAAVPGVTPPPRVEAQPQAAGGPPAATKPAAGPSAGGGAAATAGATAAHHASSPSEAGTPQPAAAAAGTPSPPGLPGLRHLPPEAAAAMEEAFQKAASSGRRHMHLRSQVAAPTPGAGRPAHPPPGQGGVPGTSPPVTGGWRGAVSAGGGARAPPSPAPGGSGAGAAATGWPVLTYQSPAAPQGHVQIATPSYTSGAGPGAWSGPGPAAPEPGARFQATAFPPQPVVSLPPSIVPSQSLAQAHTGPGAAQTRPGTPSSRLPQSQPQPGAAVRGSPVPFPPQARRVDRCFGLLGPSGIVMDPRDEESRLEQYRYFVEQVHQARRPAAARGATTGGGAGRG